MYNKWSEREDKLLRNIYAVATREELEKRLPRHNYKAIYARAFVLGLKKARTIQREQLNLKGE